MKSLWLLTTKIWKATKNVTRSSAIAEDCARHLSNAATTKHLTWKLESQTCRVALYAWFYVYPFWYNTEMWQTHKDRRTDTRRRHIPHLAWRRAVKIDHIARPTNYNYNYHCRQRVTVDSKMLCTVRNVRLLSHRPILTIMLKLHLIDWLSTSYTAICATNTVKIEPMELMP